VTAPATHIVRLDGSAEYDKDVIGGKAWSIVRMRRLGLPVPPAFALPIEECRRYHAAGGTLADETWVAVLDGVGWLEEATGRRLGAPANPLLVSVRSGAAQSMPGMMDTILDLGITPDVERGLAELSGDPHFARANHVRFCQEYGRIVLGADIDEPAADATAADVRAAILDDTDEEVPTDPHDQLRGAIRAVFDSWMSKRAKAYRRHWRISEDGGTAVIVQAMVFGNLGGASGTGVLFTRDPLSGAPQPYGEWLPGGQGDDVVSGTHDCLPLSAFAQQLRAVHDQLLEAGRLLERENRDVQDMEFTVESGTLYLLQTRSAKRSPGAALRMAVELAHEGLIDHAEALRRITVEQVASVLAPTLGADAAEGAEILARGIAACPGVAHGRVVLDSDAADDAASRGEDSVLVRPTTSPEDVAGMIAARAIVTEVGGATSHAAVVGGALGRPSVVGVGEGATAGWEGRDVTVDGTAGVVYAGHLDTDEARPEDDAYLSELLGWATELSPIAVGPAEGAVTDIAEVGEKPDVAALTERMRDAEAVRGAVLGSPEGARAALAAGVRRVVPLEGQQPLVLLLCLAKESNEEEST